MPTALRITWQRLLFAGALSVCLLYLTLILNTDRWIHLPKVVPGGVKDNPQHTPSTTTTTLTNNQTATPISTLASTATQAHSKYPPTQPPGTIPGIPAKVWQTAKSHSLTEEQRKRISSWLEKNPTFQYELLTDGSANTYVQTRYGSSRPDIVSLYHALPIPILKADLLRYLILLADGGIWSDLDVTCEKPVAGWLPAEMYMANSTVEVGMVVGLEFDVEWRGEGSWFASQLTNWVFAARPGSRHLQFVVDEIVATLYGIAEENNVMPTDITLDMISDVVDVTGPKKMTLGIVESLSRMLGRKVDDRDISRGKEPRVVGDVVVMPGNAFAALQNGFPKDQGDVLVTHHYDGSWKGPADAARENRRKKIEAEEAAKKKMEEEMEAKIAGKKGAS
ncbi:hypothetical protein FQN50_009662 [Emmonsiellopsis sp. PD_5]|nr:hypothetical protein FQN50_009662 [Emmonsiellopsis sp. PD_5]